MRLRFLALAGVLAAFLVVIGTAAADSGTFSGSITPTDCGPLHPVTVAPGDTTIVAMAADDRLGERHHARALRPERHAEGARRHRHQPGDGQVPEPRPAGRHLEPPGLPVPGRRGRGAVLLHRHVRDQQRPGDAGRDDAGLGDRRRRRHADAHLRRGQAHLQPGDRDRPAAHRGRAAELPRPEDERLLGERPVRHDDAELVDPPLDRQRARVPRRQPGRPAPGRSSGRR